MRPLASSCSCTEHSPRPIKRLVDFAFVASAARSSTVVASATGVSAVGASATGASAVGASAAEPSAGASAARPSAVGASAVKASTVGAPSAAGASATGASFQLVQLSRLCQQIVVLLLLQQHFSHPSHHPT